MLSILPVELFLALAHHFLLQRNPNSSFHDPDLYLNGGQEASETQNSSACSPPSRAAGRSVPGQGSRDGLTKQSTKQSSALPRVAPKGTPTSVPGT